RRSEGPWLTSNRSSEWASTSLPSWRSSTSNSTTSQPSSTARRSERSVFSGSSAAAPLWPTRSGRPSVRSFTRDPSLPPDDDDRAVVPQLAADEAAALVEHDLGQRLRG